MALVLEDSGCANGGAAQASVTTPALTPAIGDLVCIGASCFASTGDDTSTNTITDSAGHTWNLEVTISQGALGGGTFPPQPITIWTTEATSTSFTVTTGVGGGGTGFAQWVAWTIWSGHDSTTPVVDTDAVLADTALPQLNMTAPVAGCAAFAVMSDWGGAGQDPPVEEAGSTLICTISNVDIQPSAAVQKQGLSGAFTTGFEIVTPAPEGTNVIGITIQPAAAGDVEGVLDISLPLIQVALDGEATASGVLDVVLPVPDAVITGEATAAGVLDVVLPVIQAAFDGELTATGTLDINLPVIDADFDGELTATAQLAIDLPVPVVALDGEVSASGQLDLVLPVPNVNLVGELPVSGVLDITLPVPEVSLTGTSAAGGATMGPCGWTIPDPLCSDTWAAVPANVKSAARDYAALVLWGATGREFGLCEITVRPCGYRKCGSDLWNWWGFSWQSGTWMPYIWQGQWFNGCACPGTCCCDPECAIRLSGDVEEILEVLIDGVPVDPDTYFVYDKTWLVRTDTTLCWPQCPDLNVPNGDPAAFQVTYLRGNPVPAALLNAASVLADEWAKACTGGECRLSNRVTSLARNGIQIDMLSPEELMDNNRTGLWEVDTVIAAINPYGRVRRGKIYAPGRKDPRMQTWP